VSEAASDSPARAGARRRRACSKAVPPPAGRVRGASGPAARLGNHGSVSGESLSPGALGRPGPARPEQPPEAYWQDATVTSHVT
jgi:hypothetical protein